MTDERVTFFIQKAGWSNYEISQHFKKLKNLVELVESCTLTKQKAKWYQEGVEAEREACKREWVGLTDEEIIDWWESDNKLENFDMTNLFDFARAVRTIQAKLKEKNT